MRRKRTQLIVAAGFIAAGVWAPHVANAGPSGGALPPQLVLEIFVADDELVPYDVLAVALNVTVVDPVADGFLTVYPCDEAEPGTSNLNYRAGVAVPNAVISRVDFDGYVCVATSAATDVIVDVAGYFPAGSPLTPLDNPERILDTRNGIGSPAARVLAGNTLEFQVGGRLSTPADASAAVINVTAVNASAAGFATVYPCGQPVPNASNLNFAVGQTVPSLVIARLGTGGKVCVQTTATIDILADVSGYFPAGTVGYTAIDNPERILDTRNGTGAPIGRARANSELGFQVVGKAGVPATATAVVLNVTATQASAAGFTTVYACGTAVPNASNLNFRPAADVPNLVIAKIGADGRVCTKSSADVGLIADVAGYFEGADAYVPLDSPHRAADTREDGELRCNLAISHMVNNSVKVTDLKTGAQRTVSHPLMVEPTYNNRTAILEDCSGFIAVVKSASPGLWDIAEFHFDGQATTVWAARTLPTKLVVLDDGTALVMDDTTISDARTKQVLVNYGGSLPGIPSYSTHYPIDVTADGIAVLQSKNGGFPGGLEYYYVYDGYLLWTGPAPQSNGQDALASVSRYGTYMSTVVGSMYAGRFSVETIDGVRVVTSPFTITSWGLVTSFYEWVSDGTMLVCDGAYSTAVYRWDIFSTPTLLYDNGGCPATAG